MEQELGYNHTEHKVTMYHAPTPPQQSSDDPPTPGASSTPTSSHTPPSSSSYFPGSYLYNPATPYNYNPYSLSSSMSSYSLSSSMAPVSSSVSSMSSSPAAIWSPVMDSRAMNNNKPMKISPQGSLSSSTSSSIPSSPDSFSQQSPTLTCRNSGKPAPECGTQCITSHLQFWGGSHVVKPQFTSP